MDGTTFPDTEPANVVVTYSAGEYATVPADIKGAVMWATRDRLLSEKSENGIDPRRTSMTTDLGGTTGLQHTSEWTGSARRPVTPEGEQQ